MDTCTAVVVVLVLIIAYSVYKGPQRDGFTSSDVDAVLASFPAIIAAHMGDWKQNKDDPEFQARTIAFYYQQRSKSLPPTCGGADVERAELGDKLAPNRELAKAILRLYLDAGRIAKLNPASYRNFRYYAGMSGQEAKLFAIGCEEDPAQRMARKAAADAAANAEADATFGRMIDYMDARGH